MRQKGDNYRPIVRILKTKNGTPTKIYVSGHEYSLVHENYINGSKNKFGRS